MEETDSLLISHHQSLSANTERNQSVFDPENTENNKQNNSISLQKNTMADDDDRSHSSFVIDDETEPMLTSARTCRKTSYPHIFQLYMFSGNLFSPGSFRISSSNKFYWQRITESHNIPMDILNAEIAQLNRLVLWYMLIPKLLWIIPWLCLPVGVVIYAVEDGAAQALLPDKNHIYHQHIYWSYNGLFIFVGGGIGGVLLATQLWNHCWYLCIKAMASKINDLNNNNDWINKYFVSFDMQCDIPVLAGRSYGRAYYKIVIILHHEYLQSPNQHQSGPPIQSTLDHTPQSIKQEQQIMTKSQPMIISLKQPDTEDEERDTISTNDVAANNDPTLDLFKSLHVKFYVFSEVILALNI